MISRAEKALQRLAALNAFAFEINQIGRRAGLHNRIPWRERLARLPPDAVPLTAEEIAARGWHVGNAAPAAEVQETAPPYGKPPRPAGRRKAPRAK